VSKSLRLLTDVELELMSILWNLGEANVAQVIEALPKGRELAYTSVSTILRILEQKGTLKSRKEGRGHVYIPLLKKAEYEKRAIKHVVDHVIQGSPVDLVKRLLGSHTLKESEIQEIRALLKEKGLHENS
jgi:predicted transcriptional regulator